MTPPPIIPDNQHTAMNHRLYMANHNRKAAHAYRRFHRIFDGQLPGQFYWHMKEAIRWIQIEKHEREMTCSLNS